MHFEHSGLVNDSVAPRHDLQIHHEDRVERNSGPGCFQSLGSRSERNEGEERNGSRSGSEWNT